VVLSLAVIIDTAGSLLHKTLSPFLLLVIPPKIANDNKMATDVKAVAKERFGKVRLFLTHT
jgi:hypothetical protein